ncbi:MAG TPA: SDR family NAD(P)-dependent oxidoreductase [Pseudonocardia sp.]|jgi:NAD(P)-dependent dehydrogenase (short-subunit alcohol dehydrogenase family)|nr:SDR family NAD(P)-dependent oxidoreductase [Pseudonocardia sp.]
MVAIMEKGLRMARVLITGTSQGIGRVSALEAIRRGHQVVGTARNVGDLDGIEGLAAALRLDVTDPHSIEAAIRDAGELDALISNAGVTTNGPVETVPLSEFSRLFEINALGALRVAQPLIARFRRQGHGRLIFLSSILGQIALPFKAPYAASKFALEAIGESLAAETREFGLHVSLIEPGPVSGTAGRANGTNFFSDNDPYQKLFDAGPSGAHLDTATVTVEEVARKVVDTLEEESPALHVPVGTLAVDLIRTKYSSLNAALSGR